MFLLDLAMTTIPSPITTGSPATVQRFRVTECPWLVGKIVRWSPAGVTVKFDMPNHPFTDAGTKHDEDDMGQVGNYTGFICVSAHTEVTPL